MAEAKKEDVVMIQCIDKNVHLGNGVVLRATLNEKGNRYVDGDIAEVSAGIAKILIDNESCEKV